MVRLSEKKIGDTAVVKDLDCEGSLKQRFTDMGLFKGTKLKIISFAPLNDPMIIEINDSKIAIRKADAKKIIVQ